MVMIPKIIHYCWFGRNELPKLAVKCIASWKKHCKDYEIIEWNEENFDISKCPLYVRQAYEAKKWAFVTDYVRLKVVYDNGGIYLDTDVEVIKSLEPLLAYKAFFGFENHFVATGLGFGAEKNTPILRDIMNQYMDIPFCLPNGKYDDKGCPERNTDVFSQHGLRIDGSTQVIDDNVIVLSKEYLCPYDFLEKRLRKTKNTMTIHWYDGSWLSDETRRRLTQYGVDLLKQRRKNKVYKLVHYPVSCVRKLIGNERTNRIKQRLKR